MFLKIIWKELVKVARINREFPYIIEIALFVVSFATFQTRLIRFGLEVGQVDPKLLGELKCTKI